MSRLAARLRRLEQRLGACSLCAPQRARVELVTRSERSRPRASARQEPCPACGRLPELITVVVDFDPDLEADECPAQEAA